MAKQLTDVDKYLIYLVDKGAKERYSDKTPEYWEQVLMPRVREEIRVITNQRFSGYFLILADIIGYCHDHGIPVGPARGSAGGSVVAYCMKITEIDPLQFDLIFERFLNDARYSPPDIDVDIDWAHRQDVLQYVADKYGHDRTSQIVTFGTLSAKSLIDDLGRVLRIPKADIKELKQIIDESADGDKATYDKLIEDDRFRNKIHEVNAKEPRFAEGLAKLEGLHRHTSLHAGGVIIADQPMWNLAPTFVADRKKDKVAVQYEMFDAEAVGLLKMDLLGLKTVTHIDWAEKDVRRLIDPNFYTRGYRLDDQKAFDLINRGDTSGIFQLDGTGITRFAQEMHIDNFNDIVALLALYRPGTLDSDSASQYIARKHGKESVTYPHPDLEPILKETYGIIIYQEQVMQVTGVMAGYTMGQADLLRKAIGKKNKALMESELNKFKAKALETGKYDEKTLDEICNLIATFGRYGFNKSHAVAYAYLTYWTAVLKARYPAPFYCAWLNITSDRDKLGWIIEQMVRDGIEILPPDINQSGELFTTVGKNTVRFGLSSVRGMGKSFRQTVLSNREQLGPFTSYINFCARCTSIPADKKEALIGAGAFDFEQQQNPLFHRGFLYKNARALNAYAKKLTEKKNAQFPVLEQVPELTDLEKGELEKEYVSFYLTADPLKVVQDKLKMLGAQIGVPANELTGEPMIGGRVLHVHTLKTKKGAKMAFVDIDDGVINHSVTFFPGEWKTYGGTIVQEGAFVAVRCVVDHYKGNKTLNAQKAKGIALESTDADIVINLGKPSKMELASVYSMVMQAPKGSSRIWLKVQSNKYEFLLKSEIQVDPNQGIIDHLQNLLGKSRVKLRGGI